MEANPVLIGGKPVTQEDLETGKLKGRVTIGKETEIQEGQLAVQIGGKVKDVLIPPSGIAIITAKEGRMAPAVIPRRSVLSPASAASEIAGGLKDKFIDQSPLRLKLDTEERVLRITRGE